MYSLYTPITVFKPLTRRSFKGNIWRRLCADAVERNSGYSGYHDRYALSWDVGINSFIPDWDKLMELAAAGKCEDLSAQELGEIEPSLLEEVKEKWENERFLNRLYHQIVEGMCEGVTDADTYSTIRPEIAARYGLTGSEAKLHSGTSYDKEHKYRDGAWDHVPMFDVEWEFAGRGGKHLCLASFEGKSLKMSSGDLYGEIMADSVGTEYPNTWCQKLLAFIHECDLCFTSQAVNDEFQYQMLYRLGQDLNDALQASKAQRKEAGERQWAAERDIMTKET